VNASSMVHTATADPALAANPDNVQLPAGAEPFDSGFLTAGQRFSYTFTVAGEYRYVCLPHEFAGMIGTITVNERRRRGPSRRLPGHVLLGPAPLADGGEHVLDTRELDAGAAVRRARRGLDGVEVPPVVEGDDVGLGLPDAPLGGLGRGRLGLEQPALGGVRQHVLDGLLRVELVSADDAGRPALDPAGDVEAGEGPPVLARHPP